MSDKKKGIVIGALVLVAGGIGANLFLPKTSDLQEQSAPVIQDAVQPVELPKVQIEPVAVSPESAPMETIELPTPAPTLYLEPLVLDGKMAEHVQNITKREIAEVSVAIAELDARAWDATKNKREEALKQAIGLDFAPASVVDVKTTMITDTSLSAEPTLTLRGITGTAIKGRYAARVLWQGQFKRVEVGSQLSGYKVTKITNDSLTLKGKRGVHTLFLGESL
uniref:Type IV pilus biogenesis protein PilP n=1 Tax=Aliivibrio fischeri TaxID=668 RepID=H2ES20_ALIFS|nr:hypothetical protein [Aliivibrio fischeri]AEY78187.1 hypothetical protein [Aliivibrio fischeri]